MNSKKLVALATLLTLSLIAMFLNSFSSFLIALAIGFTGGVIEGSVSKKFGRSSSLYYVTFLIVLLLTTWIITNLVFSEYKMLYPESPRWLWTLMLIFPAIFAHTISFIRVENRHALLS